MSHSPLPWTAYRCPSCYEPDRACGFNGETLDGSYEECHHVLSLEEAHLIVRAVNCHDELLVACEVTLANLEIIGTHPDTLPMVRLRAALAKVKENP